MHFCFVFFSWCVSYIYFSLIYFRLQNFTSYVDSEHSFTLAGMSTGVATQTNAGAASGSSETVTVGSNVTLTCNIPAGNRFVAWELENLRGKLVLTYGTYANVQVVSQFYRQINC